MKKKRILILSLVCILLVAACVVTAVVAAKPAQLSKMTDEQLLEFLGAHDVVIPEGYDISLARSWIERLEKSPEWLLVVDFTVTYDFFTAVRGAVFNHYGITDPYLT